ncbi:MAG TPA: hypothetical protein PLI09_03420 [Candidatus Hydrogenedentes bacterium]|nr:hypothetical protein [Candidatus Hydrogenedentota bacterium]
MFENIATYIISLNKERLATVSLEDMALCAAWREIHQETPEQQEICTAVQDAIALWLQEAAPRVIETEGRRQQPLLRMLFQELIDGHLEQLLRDELDVLFVLWALMQRCAQKAQFARPIELLTPHIAAVQKRRESEPAAKDMPNVGQRIALFTPDDLRHAQVRDIKLFAGIDLPTRGPVLQHRGDAKLIDGLPAECTVVVENGNCHVNGLLMGNLAVSGACEILDNISGSVIARRGDIRAANILNQALAVSKESSIWCLNTQEPRMVFASQNLYVRGVVLDGVLMARNMRVGQEIQGGEAHVSESIEAGMFRHTERRPLSVILRRGFTCQDYGEVLSQDAVRMLSNASKLRQRLEHLQQMLAIIEREADECAGSVLVYLLGEEGIGDQMQKIHRLQHRVAFVDRLIVGAQTLIRVGEEKLQPHKDEGEMAPSGEVQEILEEMQRELMHLAAEGTIDRDLFEDRETVVELGRHLQRRTLTQHDVLEIVRGLLARIEDLNKKRSLLGEEVEQKINQLQSAKARAAILQRAKASCSRVEVLDQLLAAGRGPSGSEAFRRKVNERYVKLMKRNIENKLARAVDTRNHQGGLKGQLDKIRDRLWDEYMVSLPDYVLAGGAEEGVRATGRFTEGVCLCAWPHLVGSTQRGAFGVCIAEDSGETAATYVRDARGSIEPR